MIHDEDGFYTILLLPIKGLYRYQFIVDGNWTYSKNQPKMKNYNMSDYVNYINMNEYVPFSEECKCMEANKQYIMERSFREVFFFFSIFDSIATLYSVNSRLSYQSSSTQLLAKVQSPQPCMFSPHSRSMYILTRIIPIMLRMSVNL